VQGQRVGADVALQVDATHSCDVAEAGQIEAHDGGDRVGVVDELADAVIG
jgi:hypothetical protein